MSLLRCKVSRKSDISPSKFLLFLIYRVGLGLFQAPILRNLFGHSFFSNNSFLGGRFTQIIRMGQPFPNFQLLRVLIYRVPIWLLGRLFPIIPRLPWPFKRVTLLGTPLPYYSGGILDVWEVKD